MVFDFFEFSSWAVLELTDSVSIDRFTKAMSGLAVTLPSPEKETVFVVVAVFLTCLVTVSKKRVSATSANVPAHPKYL